MKNSKALIRKKLLFKSFYRGIKELDFIFEYFLKIFLFKLDYPLLVELDKLLDYPEEILYQYFVKQQKNSILIDINPKLIKKLNYALKNFPHFNCKNENN
ncbi:MAG: succinate dehydrogenase assembly factor 2 [Rickettsia sp.]|nr:succinate dehydrogenase assembly factor 2 [Rickettsia sp.]